VHAVVTVRNATHADARPLSGTMARAFEDDPVMSWLYPGVPRLESFFLNFELKLHLGHGSVYTTDGVDGGAIWAPPGKWRTSVSDVIRVAPALLRATGTRLRRALGAMQAVESKHPKEPHWYLAALGTHPTKQGKGVGSALITPILERCDAEGVPAYLESSKEANIPFYRRHGFEVTGEIHLPKGPTVWPMWRDPQSA
jgi:ribosomal protein S18 acetylase RimI-like enzyme